MCSQASNEIHSKTQTLTQIMSRLYPYLLKKSEPFEIETNSLLCNCLAFFFFFQRKMIKLQ